MNAIEIAAVCGVGCGGAALARALHPPTVRLADRVRPYNHVGRAGLGLAPDVAARPGRAGAVGNFVLPLVDGWIRGLGRRVESRSDDELTKVLHQAGRSDLGV